ncbi:hypothetical protein [Flavobacterium sp. WV_118_3]|uniref:hypothetical protein n=1 Tax=Flavobacterium sp. WV_118_3 TaxID=3151764 RepID=UPI00321ACF3D
MIKKMSIVCLMMLFISCVKTKEEKNFFSNGDFYIDYYENEILIRRDAFYKKGNLKAIIEFKNDKLDNAKIYNGKKLVSQYFRKNDTLYDSETYYDNGIVIGEGNVDRWCREIGWWNYYDRNRRLFQKQHYVILNNSQLSNQVLFYKNGLLDTLRSDIADIVFYKDKGGASFKGKLIYNRKLNEKSYVSILFSDSIKDDFSNMDSVKFDTITFGDKAIMEFPVIFESNGRKNIRGIVVEQYAKEENVGDKPVNMLERYMYIDKKVDFH